MSRKLVKPWLETYMDYVAETESPEQFRFWSGVSALSTALKRNVFIKRGFIQLFANHYIVLVGPPGCGKGTAMNPAIDLVKEANVAHYMEDRITAERATELLAAGFQSTQMSSNGLQLGVDHCATAVAPELSIFIGASEWMIPYLCTMWDKNEFTNETKRSGKIKVTNLCFGMLGGCTPQYIREINQDKMAAVASGFTSRTIFAWANKKGKTIAWPETDVNVLKDDLINDLRHIVQACRGEVLFTKEAKEKFIEFYKENDDLASRGVDFESEVLINFRARLWSHVCKLAMVLSISESDSLIIEEKHLDSAITTVYGVFSNLDITFRGVGESDLADAMDRVMTYIENKGAASRADIMRHNYRHITDEDLTRVLMTLEQIGFVYVKTIAKKEVYTHNKNFKVGKITKGATASGTP